MRTYETDSGWDRFGRIKRHSQEELVENHIRSSSDNIFSSWGDRFRCFNRPQNDHFADRSAACLKSSGYQHFAKHPLQENSGIIVSDFFFARYLSAISGELVEIILCILTRACCWSSEWNGSRNMERIQDAISEFGEVRRLITPDLINQSIKSCNPTH